MPQPHGGALRSGGTPGNKGGTGRPPNAIRDRMRSLLDDHGVPFLEQTLTGTVALPVACPKCGHQPKQKLKLDAELSERRQVVEMLARYGIGIKDEVNVISPEVRTRLQQTVAVISSREQWDSAALLKELDGIW